MKLKKLHMLRIYAPGIVPLNPEADEEAREYLRTQHTKRRQEKTDKIDEFHDDDRMSHRRHKHIESESDATDHVEKTFPDVRFIYK